MRTHLSASVPSWRARGERANRATRNGSERIVDLAHAALAPRLTRFDDRPGRAKRGSRATATAMSDEGDDGHQCVPRATIGRRGDMGVLICVRARSNRRRARTHRRCDGDA